MSAQERLDELVVSLRACTLCPRMHRPAQTADGLVGAQQRLHGNAAHGDDHPGLHQRHLALQKGLAGGQFFGRRVAVARRSAFQRVGDEHLLLGWAVVSAQAQCGEHAVQQLAGGTDKGLALEVFLLARGFAHHHAMCAPVTQAKHRLAAAFAQTAGPAAGHRLAKGGPVQVQNRAGIGGL